jgi:hypothetical protein
MSQLKLKVTDSLVRSTTGFPAIPSISFDGKKVFVLYQITETSNTDVMAEIFDNSAGTLSSMSVLNPDIINANFYSCDDGHANKSFTKFCVVDDDQGGVGVNPIGNIRIRVFDINFNQLLSRTDIQFAVGIAQTTFPVIGGVFSDDDKYILLTYLINATPNAQVTRLHVLSALDLSDVAMVDFAGSSFGANFIQLYSDHTKTYIAVTSQNGDFQFGFDTPIGSTVSNLLIYKLKNGNLYLKKSTNLPQIINPMGLTVKVSGCKKYALIGASTRRAALNDSVFTDDSNNQSLDCEGREFRVYLFKKHHLELVKSKKTTLTTYGPTFYPQANMAISANQVADGDASFFNAFDINGSNLKITNGTFGGPPYFSAVFNQQGNWLVVAGSDQHVNLDNIILYQVVYVAQ